MGLDQMTEGRKTSQSCDFFCLFLLWRREDRILFSFVIFFVYFLFPLSGGLWGQGERGTLLGPTIRCGTGYGHVKSRRCHDPSVRM